MDDPRKSEMLNCKKKCVTTSPAYKNLNKNNTHTHLRNQKEGKFPNLSDNNLNVIYL